jgi:hypothetical protein
MPSSPIPSHPTRFSPFAPLHLAKVRSVSFQLMRYVPFPSFTFQTTPANPLLNASLPSYPIPFIALLPFQPTALLSCPINFCPLRPFHSVSILFVTPRCDDIPYYPTRSCHSAPTQYPPIPFITAVPRRSVPVGCGPVHSGALLSSPCISVPYS